MMLYAMIRASGSREDGFLGFGIENYELIRMIRAIRGQKFDFSSTIPNKFTKFTA